jgi:hypothetical protein
VNPNDIFAIFGMAFTLVVLVLVTIVIVVVIWQSFATRRARMSVEREEAYSRLAERAGSSIQKTAEVQQKIAEGVDELRARMAEIEKMLREVN